MTDLDILIVGGGIGGLSAAIALRAGGFRVTLVEKEAAWSAYGVGIIQQANVVRAMDQLGVLDDYVAAGCGFDAVEIYRPDGVMAARVPAPSLVPGRPANVGIGRRALQKVLADRAIAAGTGVRLGQTVAAMDDNGDGVAVTFADGSTARYDLVIGADGIYSATRQAIFPEALAPAFTGQAVWRYNLPRPAGMDALRVYNGAVGIGLVPMSADEIYMFVTTPAPGNPQRGRTGLAAAMRAALAGAAPAIRELADQITDDDGVVYRPLETVFVDGAWSRGRIALLGDAVHATTPHLGQGAGMAVEDSLVLAEELAAHDDIGNALAAWQARRQPRCRYIVEASLAICKGQIGEGPPVDNHKATAEMFAAVSQPI